MEPHEYDALARVETTHPWFCHRRALVEALARRFLVHWPPRSVLDAGCGTGANLERWTSWGADLVVGVDIDRGAVFASNRRAGRAQCVRADLTRLPLAGDTFELAISTDVIEHIPDDVASLSEVRRVLKPGGLLILTTPAYAAAYSHHDRHLQHIRRYDAPDLVRVVRAARLQPIYWTRFNTLLTVPLWAYRKLFARPGRSDVGKPVPTPLRTVLDHLWGTEARLAARVQLPLGMTHVLVLRPM